MIDEVYREIYEEIINGIIEDNYVVFDLFFSEETLLGLTEEIQKKIDEEELRRAGIGNKFLFTKDEVVRTDKIQWINNHSEIPCEKSFLEDLKNFYLYLNRTCFTNIKTGEFHYACYEKGAFYKRHIDQFINDDQRKFSVVTYLNKNWQKGDGGELILFLGNETKIIEPTWGRTIIFKSDLIEHEVAKANKKRLSITGWLK